MFILDRNDNEPLYIQIYERIKRDIAEGRLKKGEKLTSGRLLAENIGVSRNTVDLAYEKLVSEGLVVNKARRGYFVDAQPVDTAGVSLERRVYTPMYDMRRRYASIRFPSVKWKQYAARAITDYSGSADGCGVFGDVLLRREISRFLYQYRSIECSSDDIVLLNGIESCLGVLFALSGRGTCVSVPDYDKKALDIAKLCGMDTEKDVLSAGGFIYIKPFSGYENTSDDDRRQLLDEAKEKGLYIIENEKGFLFDDSRIRMPALRSVNEDVVYIGSFADVAFPAANMAYMVMPPAIKAEFDKAIDCFAVADAIICRTLAYFMRDRNWERYLYRLAAEEKEKLVILKNACKAAFGRVDKVNYAEGTVTVERTASENIRERAAAADIMIEAKGDSIVLCARGLKKSEVEYAVRLLHEKAVNN